MYFKKLLTSPKCILLYDMTQNNTAFLYSKIILLKIAKFSNLLLYDMTQNNTAFLYSKIILLKIAKFSNLTVFAL